MSLVLYDYLLTYLKQDTSDDLRLRTTIFPDDVVQSVCLPKVQTVEREALVFINTMFDRLKRHILCLQMLNRHTNIKLRKAIIANADVDFLCCLAGCAYNILRGNFPLSEAHKKKLEKYETYTRQLTKKSTSTKKDKQILQTGGFLSTVLAPLSSSVIVPLLKQVLGG